MIALTSFSPRGYEVYGRKCLESFVEHWPCKIVVWYEEKPDFDHDKIIHRPITEIAALNEFLVRLSSVSDSDGMVNGRYNYSFDARKFCKKVFCQEATFDESELVFWLDADTITLQDVPPAFLEGLVAGVPLAYLGRKRTYTETGFIGFNTKHEAFAGFREKYQAAYTSGRIFTQSVAWHDCIAFDMARKGIEGNDLNKGLALQGLDHCFPHTVLAPYIEHNKGPARKVKAYGRI